LFFHSLYQPDRKYPPRMTGGVGSEADARNSHNAALMPRLECSTNRSDGHGPPAGETARCGLPPPVRLPALTQQKPWPNQTLEPKYIPNPFARIERRPGRHPRESGGPLEFAATAPGVVMREIRMPSPLVRNEILGWGRRPMLRWDHARSIGFVGRSPRKASAHEHSPLVVSLQSPGWMVAKKALAHPAGADPLTAGS